MYNYPFGRKYFVVSWEQDKPNKFQGFQVGIYSREITNR